MAQAKTLNLADQTDPARRRWENLAALTVILLAAIVGCNQIWDSDLFWHLRSGQWMLQNGQILGHDPFSVDGPSVWVNVHWFFQVVAACFYAIGQFPGLVVMKMLGFAAAMATVVLWLRRRVSPPWLLLVGVWTILAIENRIRIRPELATFSLLGLTLVLVESVRQGASTRRLWWLLPINALWVNMHGLFFIGPMVTVLALAGAFADRLLKRPTIGNLASLKAVVPIVLSLAACFISPWPAEAPFHPLILKERVNGEMLQYIYGVSELYPTWKIDSIRSILHSLPLLLAAIMAVALLLAMRGRWRRVPIAHLLWFAIFLAFGAMSVRNIALFVFPTAFLLALHGGDSLAELGKLWPRTKKLLTPATVCLMLGSAVLAGLFVTEAWYVWQKRREMRWGFGLSYGAQPVELARFLGGLNVDGDILPLDFGEGGTFICYSWPRHKVWMDGRLEVHSLQRFDDLYEIRTKMRRTDQADDPAIMPLPPSVRFITVRATDSVRLQALSASQRFRLLYVGPASVCFLRIPMPGEKVAWPVDQKVPEGNLAGFDKPLAAGQAAPLLSQYEQPHWYRQNVTPWHWIHGGVFYSLGQDQLAIRYLTVARQLEPWTDQLSVDAILAQSYQRLCESRQMDTGLDVPIDPNLCRAQAIFNTLPRKLDNEDTQTYAMVQLRAYKHGRQIDAGLKAIRDILENNRLPIPTRWNPPAGAEDFRNVFQAAYARALQSKEALRRATEDFKGVDAAMKAHLMLGKELGLIDEAIEILRQPNVSPAGQLLLGDLYLSKGLVEKARQAYAQAKVSQWELDLRNGLCDWAAGDLAAAVDSLTRAAHNECESPLPALYLGLLQEELGDYPAAAAALATFKPAAPERLSSITVGLLRQLSARLRLHGQDAPLNLPAKMLQ